MRRMFSEKQIKELINKTLIDGNFVKRISKEDIEVIINTQTAVVQVNAPVGWAIDFISISTSDGSIEITMDKENANFIVTGEWELLDIGSASVNNNESIYNILLDGDLSQVEDYSIVQFSAHSYSGTYLEI